MAASDKPFALWERIKGGQRLAALDAQATKRGLKLEQALADARAIVPDLLVQEINHDFLEGVFADFADWHSNASPIVAVLTDQVRYGQLALDITGVSHLFGGEAQMLAILTNRLRKLGYAVQGSIASTIGAAWALAQYQDGRVLPPGEERTALADLPVAALRLGEEQVELLNQLGLKQVGQLWGRDRRALQARFGETLLVRLDQAAGMREEQIKPRIPVAERFTERRFAEPIGLLDDVLMCARDLAIQLTLRLEQESMGAQSFHLFVYRVDHKVMSLSVNAARATRDPAHIARLFSHRAERLMGEYDPGFGIDMIRLAASSVTELGSTQLGAFTTDNGAADLDRLYDRLSSRLGPLAVVRTVFVSSHIPERAARLEPVVVHVEADPAAVPDASVIRPLRLFPAPEPIKVLAQAPDGPPLHMIWRRERYRLVKTAGPERIEAEWHRTNMKLDHILPEEKEDEEKHEEQAKKTPPKPPEPNPRDKLKA
ncbi:MAG TPA: DNA polymerase Y family protein, partial [Devosia sp.]